MKKSGILVILIFMFLITGCNKSKQLSCSKTTSEENVGYSVETKVVGKMENDSVVGVDLKMIMSFEDEERAKESYQVIMEGLAEDNIDVSISGKMIRVAETDEYSSPLTKDEFIASYQEDGYVCEW